MDTNLYEFMALVKRHGLARPNRFHANIYLPPALGEILSRQEGDARYDQLAGGVGRIQRVGANPSGSLNSARHLSLAVQSVTIPGLNLSTNDLNVGYKRKVVYDLQRTDSDYSFICTGNMFEKKIMEEWVGLIMDKNHRVEYYDNYVGSAEIIMYLNGSDDDRYRLLLTEFYPTAVNPVSLDRSSTNSAANLSVGFTFRQALNQEPATSVLSEGEEYVDPSPLLSSNQNGDGLKDLQYPNAVSLPNMVASDGIPPDVVYSSNRIKSQVEAGMDRSSANMLLDNINADANNNPRLTSEGKAAVSSYINGVKASL